MIKQILIPLGTTKSYLKPFGVCSLDAFDKAFDLFPCLLGPSSMPLASEVSMSWDLSQGKLRLYPSPQEAMPLSASALRRTVCKAPFCLRGESCGSLLMPYYVKISMHIIFTEISSFLPNSFKWLKSSSVAFNLFFSEQILTFPFYLKNVYIF